MPNSDEMTSVSVRDLDIHYDTYKAIDRLNLDIQTGEFLVLLGPSGCGKSTLLNSIAGLLDVTRGEVWIDGRNVTWVEPSDRSIGMVFQSYALYPRMNVEQNLSFGLKMARVPKPEIAERVKRVAHMLQLDELLKRKPSELSGGQRQRVAIGRALVRDAEVFLFDEPLSNLDAKLRVELRVQLKRLHQKLGNTMIYVTHDQIEALTLADRVAVMKNGVIQQLASPREIYRWPANRFVADFIGSPGMNFFDGHVEGNAFHVGNITIPLDAYQAKDGFVGDCQASLGIRPEHIGVGAACNGIEVKSTVQVVEPMGADTLVWTEMAGKPLSIRVEGERHCNVGDPIHFAIPPECISLFDRESGERL